MHYQVMLSILLNLTLLQLAWSAPVSQAIKMDYFGYRPSDTKIAIFSADPGSTVEIRDTSNAVVYTIPSTADRYNLKVATPSVLVIRSGGWSSAI